MTKITTSIEPAYGKLTVVGLPFRKPTAGQTKTFIRVQCECGNIRELAVYSLKSGNTTSCGCVKIEKFGAPKHGLYKHPAYRAWASMKARCYDNKNKRYHRYGGRGIIVCAEWINSPEVFIAWAIPNGYRRGLQVDRIDNDGNYEPTNCTFATAKENNRHTSRTKLNHLQARIIRHLYKQIPTKEICAIFRIAKSTVASIANKTIWKD